MNISNLLSRHARKYPHNIAVISMEHETTYQALDEEANRLGNVLLEAHISKGDKVAIFMPNVREFAALYFAIQRVGAIVVPVNAKFVTSELEYVLSHSDAKALFVHELLMEQAKKVQFTGLKVKTGKEMADWQSYGELVEKANNDAVRCNLVEDDDSTLLYTSGTTGNPKGVLLTNRNVLTVSHMIAIEMEVKPESRLLIMMPLTHSAPLNLFFVTAILVGATAVFTPTFTPNLFIDTIEKYRTTHFFGAPVAYLLTASNEKMKTADLSSMKYWVYGGAPLSKQEVAYIQKQFQTDRLVCVYGLTEAGPSGTILHAEEHLEKPGSIGRRAPFGTEIRIINEDNEDVAPGEIGEIILYGEGNMKEYYKNPEETSKVFIDGWIRSGDLAFMDEDGYYYIVDRKKDVIISGGVNIYPKEIEDIVLLHPAIIETAVIGIPHPEWGETVKVIYAANTELPEQEVRTFLQDKLAAYKIPKIYEQVESLPRNASGKILKQHLREEQAHASVGE